MATHVRGMMEETSAGSSYRFRELRTFYDEVSHHFGESSKSSENREILDDETVAAAVTYEVAEK